MPFGWQVGPEGDLIEVPQQQAAIQRARELRQQGLSLRAISAALAQDGTKLSHEGVKNLLAARVEVPEQQAAIQRARELRQRS